MALAFQTVTIPITNEVGPEIGSQGTTFSKEIKKDADGRPVAQVAIQSFKLDLIGNARPTDIVQVTASSTTAGATVNVKVKTDYSGGAYQGEVTALVIADLKD